LTGGELLAGIRPAAGVHHRGQVVGADVAFDEHPGRQLDALRAQRRGVQVVQHDHVDAPVGALQVGAHVGLDRLGCEHRTLGALDRDVDERERGDLLGLAVFEHLEVRGLEPGHELTLAIQHAGIDFDVIDFGAEGDRRLLGLRRLSLFPLREGDGG
jgi:hypothetical protein